ncbi:MscS family inner membrane protein YnaI [Ruegeria denitrificans]|uniref:Small-conductance mechanosensitive channel n=2 Tax=Ruegeria denitrificans TaxID=1715692 RepID=A0A0P1I958_9RHOB|nr:MscS family inner membrane protein YnaI [Ruegeria denitrificans]
MNLVQSVDEFVQRHVWFAIIAIVLFALWVVWRPQRPIAMSRPVTGVHQVLNLIGGVLTVSTVMSLYALASLRFDAAQHADLAAKFEFSAFLIVYVTVSVVIARSIELFWISRSSFIDEGHIPGLPRVLLFGAAIILGLTTFGVSHGLSINGLYLSTGAMAAIIAFAMQRTLGDLFSGISLSVEHPFKIGDWIELEDGTKGEVRDLNWRATRLRGWDNTTLIVPNSKLAAQTFRNLHGPDHRYSPMYTVTLPPEIDPRFAKSLLLEVALKCKRLAKTPLPSVRLVDSGTVPYRYIVWLHFPSYPSMFAGREEFFRELHYSLKQAGIQAAPSMQDVRFQAAEKVVATPPTTLHALRSLDFASLFDEAELESLNSRSYSAIFDAGTVILPEGEVSPSVYIVLNGVVETSVTDASGKTRVLNPLVSGEYFGLASMLTDAPSFQTFTASSDVVLVQIDRKCFKDIASQREDLLQGFAEIVESRMAIAASMKNDPGSRRAGPLMDVLQRIEKILGS